MANLAAASGIALIGALGNLDGFIAPTLQNSFTESRQGMLALASAGVVGVVLLLSIGARARRASSVPFGASKTLSR